MKKKRTASLKQNLPVLIKKECILFKWFYNNFMVFHPEKCSFMLLGVDNSLQTNLVYGDEIFINRKLEEVLGVALDSKLNFATQLLNITKNAYKKFNTLTRFQKYIIVQKSLYFLPLLNRNLRIVR